MIELLVVGTNRCTEEKGARAAIQRLWKRVAEDEIRVFLALLINMGAHQGMGTQELW